jgi:hypothetical protein
MSFRAQPRVSADPATPCSVTGAVVGVLVGKLMAVFAVCSGLGFGNVGGNGVSRRVEIQVPSWLENVGKAHSGLCALLDRVTLEIWRPVMQFNHKIANGLNGHITTVPAVPLLLFPSGPAAVFWRIITVIVDTIKGGSFRAFSHVFNEIVKRIFPPVADFYSAPAVVFKSFCFWIVAPAKHGLPK